jgi:5'-deoxynucleotidase YfbR-like HD superfamily hydrolase
MSNTKEPKTDREAFQGMGRAMKAVFIEESAELSSADIDAMVAIANKHNAEQHKNNCINAWQRIQATRRLRDVHRLAGFYTTRVYTDAEHCYNVGILVEEMAALHHVHVTSAELSWAYRHDVLEAVTGDLLNPVKTASKEAESAWELIELEVGHKYPYLMCYAEKEARKWFTKDAWNLVKACDYLELWLCCQEEKEHGNILTNMDGTTVAHCMYKILSECPFEQIRKMVGVGH